MGGRTTNPYRRIPINDRGGVRETGITTGTLQLQLLQTGPPMNAKIR